MLSKNADFLIDGLCSMVEHFQALYPVPAGRLFSFFSFDKARIATSFLFGKLN
jgi:hypothetical protein